MSKEKLVASVAASRVPLYPSDAGGWDLHNGAVMSPTMHLLPISKRLEDMVKDMFREFNELVTANYGAMSTLVTRFKTDADRDIAGLSTRLDTLERELSGMLTAELDPVFTEWLDGKEFVYKSSFSPYKTWLDANMSKVLTSYTETDPVFTKWLDGTTVHVGKNSAATDSSSIAIGRGARSTAAYAVQIGDGTNNTPSSFQFRDANLFIKDPGVITKLGDDFPKASKDVFGAVKIGDGLDVRFGLVSAKAQDKIVKDGGEIRADGSIVTNRSNGEISYVVAPWKYGTTVLAYDESRHTISDLGEPGVDEEFVWANGSAVLTGTVRETRDSFGIVVSRYVHWYFFDPVTGATVSGTGDCHPHVEHHITLAAPDGTVFEFTRSWSGETQLATINDIAYWARTGHNTNFVDANFSDGPVVAVNGKTGPNVDLSPSDIGAVATGWEPSRVVGPDGTYVSYNRSCVTSSTPPAEFDAWKFNGVDIPFTSSSSSVDTWSSTSVPGYTTVRIQHVKSTSQWRLWLRADGESDVILSVSYTTPGETELDFGSGYIITRKPTEVVDSLVLKSEVDALEKHVDVSKRYIVTHPLEDGGSTYQLVDCAINVVNLSTAGEYTFVFPPRTDDRVRDFVLKLNVTADPLPTVQFVKHATDDAPPRFEGSDGWGELEIGVNFFGFTETS